MTRRQGWFNRVRYVASLSFFYVTSGLFLWFIISPSNFLFQNPSLKTKGVAFAQSAVEQAANNPPTGIIFGKPTRIVVVRLGIDLPIVDGVYNPGDGSWTLYPGQRAYFAVLSALANDFGGNTFIYGHNNNRVFGHLKQLSPGDSAEIYTDNDHVFKYTYKDAHEYRPDEGVTIFQYQGPPILTIQTCSGSFNEWRRFYNFSFTGVN